MKGAALGDVAITDPAAGLRRILLNAGSLLGAYVIPRLFTFVAVVVAARVLGVSEFGAYGTAAAFAVILSIVSTAGMMPLLVRDLAREPERTGELMAAAHAAKVGMVLLMMAGLLALAVVVLRYPPAVTAAAVVLGLAYSVRAFEENLGAYFQARERMGVWMQASAMAGLTTGLAGIVLVVATGSLVAFCFGALLGEAAGLGWLVLHAPAEVRPRLAVSPAVVRQLLKDLAPFVAAFVALAVYSKVDVLLLARWRTQADVGLYTAAYKFVDIAQALAVVAVTAIYPRLSRGEGAAQRNGGKRVAELVLIAGVPAAGVLWLLAPALVPAVFGPDYHASAPVLLLLAPALPVLALNITAGYVLAAARRMAAVAALYAGALALKVSLDALLIPAIGPRGAAITVLSCEIALAVGMYALLRRYAAAAPGPRSLLTAGAAAVLCAAMATAGAAPALAVPLYLVLVTFVYWWARAVPATELAMVRRAILP